MKFAISVLYWLMIIALIASLFEMFFNHNYATDLLLSLFPKEDMVIDAQATRFATKRCNAVFSYFSTYGVVATFSFVVFFVQSFILKMKDKNYALIAILCFLGAFTCGSRALFLGLFLCGFLLMSSREFTSSSKGKMVLWLTFFLLPVLIPIGEDVWDSIVNSDTSSVAGSDASLRKTQWECCEAYFLQSMWLGNGRLYIWDVVRPQNPMLLGAESIWFSIMVDYGILGAVAFLTLVGSCCVLLYKCYRRLVCLPLGYLLVMSLTPENGIQYNVLISFTILLTKMFIYQSRSVKKYGFKNI